MTPQAFWRSVLSKYWDRRPVRIERPDVPPIIQKSELFEVLVQQGELYRTGQAPVAIRAYIDGNQYSSRSHIESLLPEASDGSLERYAGRIAGMSAVKHWGLILNGYYRFSELQRKRVLDFSVEIRRNVGIPTGGVTADIYVGSYLRTPFGVHKDEQHVFTWVVHGKKKILLWPFECFAGFPGITPQHRNEAFRLPFQWNIPRRDDATVLEGSEGDIFYWPSSFWHIAASEGEFVATATVGFAWEETAPHLISDALQMLVQTTAVKKYVQTGRRGATSEDLRRAARRLRRAIKDRPFDDVVEGILLARTQTLYLKDDIPNKDEPALTSADVVRCDIRSPVVWKRRGKSLLCAVYGRHFSVKATPGMTRVLRLLNTGAPVSVGRVGGSFRGKIGGGAGKADVEAEVAGVLQILQRLRFLHVVNDRSEKECPPGAARGIPAGRGPHPATTAGR